MIEAYFFRTPTLNRLRSGPLGSDLDDLATSLRQQGYAWDSIRGYLEAAISSLDGCSSKGMPLQMSIKPSSSATSADCNGLLQADCPKRPKDCPTCSSSGARNSGCQSASMHRLIRRQTNGCFDMSSTWIKSVGPPPALAASLSAHGKVCPRRLFWYRPPGVAILASSSDLRFCAAKKRPRPVSSNGTKTGLSCFMSHPTISTSSCWLLSLYSESLYTLREP